MRIEWSDQALEDLSDILHYVVDYFGEAVAYRVNNEINDDVDVLAQFPMMGSVLFFNRTRNITYRTFSTRHYKIIYYIKDNVLKITLLWNNRRDSKTLKRQLSNTESY
jgi:plasmid stabilization system protein ParE